MSFAQASTLLSRSRRASENVTHSAGRRDRNHILAPLLTPDESAVADQLHVAAALARTTDASLHVVSPSAVPEEMSVEHRQDVTTDHEQALVEWGLEQVSTRPPQIEEQVLNPRGLSDGIRYITGANNIDTLVVTGDSMDGRLRRSLPERIALRADCDIVTVNGRYGHEQVPSILLAVAGGPHSGLATDIAQYIATDCDSWIDILYVADEDASEHQRQRAESYLETAFQRIERPESTTTWVLEARDAATAIIEQSAYYELTVLGSPSKGRLQRFISGSTSKTIRDNAESAVLSAWYNQ